MTPDRCPKCQVIFEGNGLLQAEMRHLALTQGPGVAAAELNERLAEEHAGH